MFVRNIVLPLLFLFSDGVGIAAGVIFPSLLQLPSGITELDDKKQRRLCMDKFRRMDGDFSEVDLERELECGICLELNAKTVLPDCAHSLCFRCFEDWYEKSDPYSSNSLFPSLYLIEH